jgi:hypothetical protein
MIPCDLETLLAESTRKILQSKNRPWLEYMLARIKEPNAVVALLGHIPDKLNVTAAEVMEAFHQAMRSVKYDPVTGRCLSAGSRRLGFLNAMLAAGAATVIREPTQSEGANKRRRAASSHCGDTVAVGAAGQQYAFGHNLSKLEACI